MDAAFVSNHHSFEKFLLDQDDETIRSLGWEFSSWVVMFMTLFYYHEDLTKYLERKLCDFTSQPSEKKSNSSLKVARYLYSMDKEHLRDLYIEFIQIHDIISDLMILNDNERIRLIAHQLNWKAEDLNRFNFISVN